MPIFILQDANKRLLMPVCWVIITVLLGLAVSMLDLEYLKMIRLCDIQQNMSTGMVEFDCHGRKLEEMPKVFKNTTVLDVSNNEIKNLTLDSLQNLKSLTLNWMNTKRTNKKPKVNMAEGVFANLTELQYLSLNGLGLLEVPAQLPKSLQQLKLDNNNIFSLSPRNFSQLKNLTHIYLSKNCFYRNPCGITFNIDNGTFSDLNKLKHLSLSYNNLTHVPRNLPVSLITLELASNMISFIGEHDFKNLKNLRTLKIQGNCPRCYNAPYPCVPCVNGSIRIHKQAFDHLEKLYLLHLAGNSLKVIENAWFKNIWQLRELYLSYNFLTRQINEDGAFLSNLSFLKKLDLSFNYGLKDYPETVRLAPNFANLSSLTMLHIEGLVFKKIKNDSLASLYGLQNLTTLDIGINFIVNVDQDIFRKFHNVKLLYLAENRLYPITKSEIRTPDNSVKPLRFNIPALTDSPSENDKEPYRPIPKLVKRQCFSAGRVLDLSRNNLFFISPEQFVGYEDISCLNLSSNGFAAALNGTEFTSLPHLKYLDLSYNKIDLAYDFAFEELKELEVLDLSFNPHYFTVRGVTHNLNFLKNLPKLRVLNMSSNSIFTLTSNYMYSNSLAELQFQHNQLGRLWKDENYEKLFWHLKNLTHLDISYNKINNIPRKVYKYLPVTIKIFRLKENGLTNLNWTLMRTFTQLEELILGHNNLMYVSKEITQNIPSLRYLDLSNNKISQLETKFLQDAFNLNKLDLSYNKLSTINQSTFPDKAIHLKTVMLHKNPFRCTCEIFYFILWIFQSDVKIPYLVSLRCSVPDATKGSEVINFDLMQCNYDEIAFLAYLLSTLLIIVVSFVATLMHVFYWDFSYVFYYMKAKFKGYHHLSSEENVYGAFVSYDTKDPQVSEWVLNHLRAQLEEQGDGFLPVCLEERDWLPGCPVLDSLTQSIRQSRKTVFVLTHSYVNSGSFKMAMYLAHQRLLDDSEDVIVLLLLEPVLQNSHFLRLRKRLCSHSVLEWPRTPAAEPWFWQCLRNAIRLENKVMYNNIYSRYFTIKKSPREKD